MVLPVPKDQKSYSVTPGPEFGFSSDAQEGLIEDVLEKLNGGVERIVVDLSRMESFTQVTPRAMLLMYRAAKNTGVAMEFVNVGRQYYDAIEMTGFAGQMDYNIKPAPDLYVVQTGKYG